VTWFYKQQKKMGREPNSEETQRERGREGERERGREGERERGREGERERDILFYVCD
jgi:hypothetical protein